MKLLICSVYSPIDRDGVSNSTRCLVSALEKKGVNVTVFTTNLGWKNSEISECRSDKLRVFKSFFNNNYDFSIQMANQLMKNILGYDFVHFNSTYSFSTTFGAYLARKKKIPYSVLPQGNAVPFTYPDFAKTRSAIKKIIFFKLFSSKTLHCADTVICNSKMEMDSLKRHLNTENIISIPNGMDIKPYDSSVSEEIIYDKLNLPRNKTIFLFLGRLSHEKAIPFLLNVWDKAVDIIPGSILVIAGMGESSMEAKIKNKIKRMKHSESVFLSGGVLGELKSALLKKARCLLLPSYFESFGNVVLEALASGTPVLTSTGTQWEMLEDKKFGYWLPHDIKKWTEAIKKVAFDDSYKTEEFLLRSRKWVADNYNWDNIADQYIKVYAEIIARRR